MPFGQRITAQTHQIIGFHLLHGGVQTRFLAGKVFASAKSNSRKESIMNAPNTLGPRDEIFSIEQLEARFEVLAVPVSGGTVSPNWPGTLTYCPAD